VENAVVVKQKIVRVQFIPTVSLLGVYPWSVQCWPEALDRTTSALY
jgi:hypothetical protein